MERNEEKEKSKLFTWAVWIDECRILNIASQRFYAMQLAQLTRAMRKQRSYHFSIGKVDKKTSGKCVVLVPLLWLWLLPQKLRIAQNHTTITIIHFSTRRFNKMRCTFSFHIYCGVKWQTDRKGQKYLIHKMNITLWSSNESYYLEMHLIV